MLSDIKDVPGEALDRPSYHADAAEQKKRLDGPIWKLERAQAFSEPHDPAWVAFMAGDWVGVHTVFEEDRPAVRSEAAEYAAQGSELRRLRIVERPVTPYLQWEMHFFRILEHEGFPIRTLEATSVHHLERARPLPEVVAYDRVLYDVSYDDAWRPCGARRIDDIDVVRAVREEIAGLWAKAEPLGTYFEREIASLPAPATT